MGDTTIRVPEGVASAAVMIAVVWSFAYCADNENQRKHEMQMRECPTTQEAK